MALETASDLNSYFDTDAHGTSVTFSPVGSSSSTINAIFNNEYELVDIGEHGVESSIPLLTVKSSDVTGISQGDGFTVNGVTYKAVIIRPDGTGITEIQLETQ